MSENKNSDIRPIGAMICIMCGVWLFAEATVYGAAWRYASGGAFLLFGLIRGYYLLSEKSGESQ